MSDVPFHELTPGPLPRVWVVIHRAADQTLAVIVNTVRRLTHLAETEAWLRIWEAYHRGRALVLSTHLERAELYVEQFAEHGLIVSIEPA